MSWFVDVFKKAKSEQAEEFTLKELGASQGVADGGRALAVDEDYLTLLFGDPKRSELEIGMQQTWAQLKTGTWLLMRAPSGDIDLAKLKLDPATFHLTDQAGDPYRKYPYLVLGIEGGKEREDWMNIPDLKGAYELLRKAVTEADLGNEDDKKKIKRLFMRFQTLCEWSPDLVTADATRLVAKVRDRLPLAPRLAPTADPGEFKDVRLYDSADAD
jgi:hypothetical protein